MPRSPCNHHTLPPLNNTRNKRTQPPDFPAPPTTKAAKHTESSSLRSPSRHPPTPSIVDEAMSKPTWPEPTTGPLASLIAALKTNLAEAQGLTDLGLKDVDDSVFGTFWVSGVEVSFCLQVVGKAEQEDGQKQEHEQEHGVPGGFGSRVGGAKDAVKVEADVLGACDGFAPARVATAVAGAGGQEVKLLRDAEPLRGWDHGRGTAPGGKRWHGRGGRGR